MTTHCNKTAPQQTDNNTAQRQTTDSVTQTLSPPTSGIDFIDNETSPIQRKSNGLPTPLKHGIESLSGIAMDDVNVHYHSPKPAQLQAHAYAQGTDIHLASGQEHHLPHEAWHVVQQKQGRVTPTQQLKAWTINDDPALEREADDMGNKAQRLSLQPSSNQQQPLQRRFLPPHLTQTCQRVTRVKAGIEYTEEDTSKNYLKRYNATDALTGSGNYALMENVTDYLAAEEITLFGENFTVFHVPKLKKPSHLPSTNSSDETWIQQNNIKLINDVLSPEWIIEGHHGQGVSHSELVAKVNHMLAMRSRLKDSLAPFYKRYANEYIVLTPSDNVEHAVVNNNNNNVNDIDALFAEEFGLNNTNQEEISGLTDNSLVFEYKMAEKSMGSAQITAKYSNKKTIGKISEVNLSRYLPEGSIKEDISYIEKKGWTKRKFFDKTPSPEMETLRQGLSKTTPTVFFSKEDVGTLKMMILSDAMATLMTRYNATFGQAFNKDMQSFFPKSKRQHYIHALAGEELPTLLTVLRPYLMRERNSMIKAFKKNLVLKSLDISHIHQQSSRVRADALAELRQKIILGTATKSEKRRFDGYIFGANNRHFKARLAETINAYTEQPTENKHILNENQPNEKGAVVSSKEYANAESSTDTGAIFERRGLGRDVPMGDDNLKGIKRALQLLLEAAS